MKKKQKNINTKKEYTIKYFFNKDAKININDIFKNSFLSLLTKYNK